MAAALLYGCHKAPIESGVSRELAQERATHISNVRYELTFHLPEDKEEPVLGTEVLTFSLDSRREVLLDFREGADNIKSLKINGKDAPVNWESEHLRLGALLRGELMKRNLDADRQPFIAVYAPQPMEAWLAGSLPATVDATPPAARWYSQYELFPFGAQSMYAPDALRGDALERRARQALSGA